MIRCSASFKQFGFGDQGGGGDGDGMPQQRPAQAVRHGAGLRLLHFGAGRLHRHQQPRSSIMPAKSMSVDRRRQDLYPPRWSASIRRPIGLDQGHGRPELPLCRIGSAVPRVGDGSSPSATPSRLGGTVTAGIVSARGRDIGSGPYDDFIQIDAPVNQRPIPAGRPFDLPAMSYRR